MAQRVNYGSWWRYSWQRLSGIEPGKDSLYDMEPHRSTPGHIVLTSFGDRRDRTTFSSAYNDPESGITTGSGARPPTPICTGPLGYAGGDMIKADIAHFKAALAASGVSEGFMTAVAPASCARIGNQHYKTDEEFLYACAEAMREEYKAIVNAGIDDRLVFLAHRLGAGVEEFLVGFVVLVADAGAAGRRHRGHKAFADPGSGQRRLEVGDVGLDHVAAGIAERAGADRGWRARTGAGRDARFRIVVGGGKGCAVAPVAKARQHDMAGRRAVRLHVVERVLARFYAAEALPRIAPPRPVIDALRHRLAEFAVARHIDAEPLLLAHDIGDGLAERLLELGRVGGAGFARLVGCDQRVRPRQAADMAGQDVVGAGAHAFLPSECWFDDRVARVPRPFRRGAAGR